MANLSWNLRLVIGVVLLVIIASVLFFVYYNIQANNRNEPLSLELYDGMTLLNSEALRDGEQRDYYVVTGVAPFDIEKFYQDRDFDCTSLFNAAGEYLRSTCLLERTHLGFWQVASLTIQPDEEGNVVLVARLSWNDSGFLG